jgi:hypothetical protein
MISAWSQPWYLPRLGCESLLLDLSDFGQIKRGAGSGDNADG